MKQYCSDCGETEHANWCHAEMIRGIQEKAWDEGYRACLNGNLVNPHKEDKAMISD